MGWNIFTGSTRKDVNVYSEFSHKHLYYGRLESFAGYLSQALVFVWNSCSLREWFNFCFARDFCYCRQIFHFGILSLKLRQLAYNSLLLIITLRFICGERKISSIIKKSQNIMNMIVCKIFLCFLYLYCLCYLKEKRH